MKAAARGGRSEPSTWLVALICTAFGVLLGLLLTRQLPDNEAVKAVSRWLRGVQRSVMQRVGSRDAEPRDTESKDTKSKDTEPTEAPLRPSIVLPGPAAAVAALRRRRPRRVTQAEQERLTVAWWRLEPRPPTRPPTRPPPPKFQGEEEHPSVDSRPHLEAVVRESLGEQRWLDNLAKIPDVAIVPASSRAASTRTGQDDFAHQLELLRLRSARQPPTKVDQAEEIAEDGDRPSKRAKGARRREVWG